MSRLFIIAGEASGDTHAAGLIREAQALDASAVFSGLGGPQMRAAAGDGIEDWLADAAVLGLWEVLKHYAYFKRKFNETLARITREEPAAVILVDYPGFNLRIAKALRRRRFGGKIIYYISPQVWAWKKGRIKTMAKALDLMICIFPFEQPLYEKSGLRTVFAGHPMVDRARQLRQNWQREDKLVGWFPGSRLNEVRRHFPVMMQAAPLIRMAVPEARFAVSAANQELANEMREMADAAGMTEAKQWIEANSVYDLMQRAAAGAVASGTATLEAACFGLPYALVYRVSGLTYIAAKAVVRIKHIGIVNILAGREVVRELVQHDLTAANLAREMAELIVNEGRRGQLAAELSQTVAMLGEGGAYARAAAAVMERLRS